MTENSAITKNLREALAGSNGAAAYAGAYLSYVGSLLQRLDVESVAALMRAFGELQRSGNTAFLAGNGGSAATASHMANDLSIGVAVGGARPLRVHALADSLAVMTALANDHGYECVFVEQLRGLYRTGDVLVAISASGNSPNLLRAAEWVRAQGGRVFALVGFDGGELRTLADVLVHVRTESGEYGPVEDVHMVLDHLLTGWLATNGGAKGAS